MPEVRLVDIYLSGSRMVLDPTAALLYQLLRERPHSANISHSKMPSLEEHKAFIAGKPYRMWAVVVPDMAPAPENAVGAVYATFSNEIGVAIQTAHWGLGYGSAAVLALMEALDPLPAVPGQRIGQWVANINPRNRASLAMFRKLGFDDHQHTLVFKRGEANG